MIEIIVNRASFEYDIHSLVKAFFSKEDVLVRVQEQFLEATKIRIAILFSDNKVQIKIWEEEKLCQEDSIEIDFEQRKETKNHLKRLLYQILFHYTGRELPWGTLTGIRPAKIAMQLLEEGKSNVEIAAYMKDTYLVSKEKVALSVMIANRERHILKDIDYQDGYSLYIGIPF